jgi:hypothetical protein
MLKRSMEKGTTVERLKITQRSAFYRAGNLVSGPEFPPLDKIFEGRKFHEFPSLQNSAKSFTWRCGATLCKGARNSDGAGNLAKSFTRSCGATISKGARSSDMCRISGGQKFHNFRPSEFLLSPFSRAVVQLSVKGPEFLAGNFKLKFLGAGISAPKPEFPP